MAKQYKKEDYMKYVNKGLVSRKIHPEDENIVILNYTEQCVFEREWNEITLACRGLIINEETGETLARPFNKFFNYGESMGNGALALPRIDQEPEVTIKHDGSLGISYMLNGEVRWATRGSFVSDQAKIAQEIWDKKYTQYNSIVSGVTLLVEIIHPQTRVVVDYNGMEDLILIGVMGLFSGNDYDHRSIGEFGDYIGMPVTEPVTSDLYIILDVAKKLDHNEEGFVLRWKDGYRLKVKGDKYLEVHRIIHGMSLKQKVESWANGNLEEYIAKLPEEFRPEIEATAYKCDGILRDMLIEVLTHYKNSEKRGRKNFAIWVNKWVEPHLRQFLFLVYDNEHVQMEDKIKQYIVKNYRELLGGE